MVGCVRPGTAALACGIERSGDLLVAESGLAGGGGQGAEVGGRVGVQGAVGGPEQAGVAIALALAGDPPGQTAEVLAVGLRVVRSLGLALGLQVPDDGIPVQAAAPAGGLDQLVGLAVDLGGRGEDVTAVGAEVEVPAGQ